MKAFGGEKIKNRGKATKWHSNKSECNTVILFAELKHTYFRLRDNVGRNALDLKRNNDLSRKIATDTER